ncbi:hypothetical protein EV694_1309 [Volucribacter psittacicida]|uniref:Uncharacterized protein n=1 Tax=Volucribacter psittacicida TaxID=203482 RepID=A0A4R1FVA2_9PAST|nr:hypothetical protein [Volucribacter psittacicida]TCJ98877.1 hypothetical protein EV694_1309 [Volucribacter psittacicida]
MNKNYVKEAWHTCPLKDLQNCKDIENIIPFKSKSKEQWLTQGYYFWLDDDHAKDWGKIRKFERYAVSKFYLTFNDEKDIFDLRDTKNLKHLAQVAKTIEQAYKQRKEPHKNIRTVAHIISFLKKKPDDIFRGIAVLAADTGCVLKKEDPDFWANSIPFMQKENKSLSRENLAITRNQLCVFEFKKDSNPKHQICEIQECNNG